MKRTFQWITVFFLIVAPVAAVAAFSYVKTYRDLTAAALGKRQTIAYLASTTLNERLDRITDVAISLATRVKFRQLIAQSAWGDAIQIMQGVPDSFSFVDRLFIADPAGRLMADEPELPGVRGKNFAFRDWYEGVIASRKPYVSKVYTRTAEPRYNVVAVAVPIFGPETAAIPADDQTLLGILVLQVQLDHLFEWSRKIDVGPDGFVYFVDREGQIAAHQKLAPQGEIVDYSGLAIIRQVLRGEQGVAVGPNSIDGREVVAAFEPVAEYGWGVVAEQPVHAAFATRNANLRFLSVIYGVILLVSCLLAYTILRAMTVMRQTGVVTRRLNAQLQTANKELEAFSYSVSHDLRAPLRAIDGFSLALLEDCADRLDDQGRSHLERIRAASTKMAQLIDDLLNLSRVSRSEMHREPVNLSDLARAILAELQQSQPNRHVECSIVENMTANGDARLLRIALENLLGNAWKFTGNRDRARIEFGVTGQNGARTYMVRDNGAGFDMTYADKLFGVFQRLHTSAEFGGTGIGLATVRRIIHRHGGKIWGEGTVGEGAAFFFTLPSDGK